VPIDYAFRTLAEKMGTWWPPSHHIGKTPFAEIVIEPRVGGRWFERDDAGNEWDWGKVLVFDPPKQLVVSWHLQADWTYDPDMSRASEVAFRFIEEGSEATRMEFEHRHLERHGEGWERIRAGVDSPGGWTGVLAQYQHRLEGKLTAAGLTDAEREYALAELQDAQSKFHDATRNLTPRQWSFRSAPGRWSPAECAEHIAVIESVVLDRVLPNALQAPADPEKRKALKYSDAAVLRLGSEPEPKLNAPEAVLPAGRWNAPEEILSNISNLRGRTEQFVKSTQEDLRNRFADHPVFGTLDLYQWILLVGAHMRRHTGQIEHEKSHQDFPEA
jgi:uncharacterized protein YndB with AHSA1/START domain